MDKKPRCFALELSHSLEKSFTMTIQIFVDLQGFIIEKKFIMKEMMVLRNGVILSNYIFTCPMSRNFLTKLEKYCASWLSVYHHGLQWEDEMIPYMVKRLIIVVVIGEENDNNKSLVYQVCKYETGIYQ